ncbi:MAG: hypothetical protein ABL966_01745 [Acidimicrobiales bacterium]
MASWDDDADDFEVEPSTLVGLRDLIEVQRDTVSAIATGTSIESRNVGYRRRRIELRAALKAKSLADPFSIWPDLDTAWAWAKNWGTYAERRAEIAKRVTPLLDQLDDLERSGKVDDWGGSPDEWMHLEERLSGLREEMDHASTLDQYQDVGRRGREVIIEVVDLIFTSDMVPAGEDQPKGGDAKARFDFVLDAYASGKVHAELRKVMRSAWDLAQKVTHGDITRVDAYAAAQATVLVVRTIAEMHREGRSD